jgi:Rps23 Pro-64 3,4-dihydroxylase Tpa1-like proline 4-hydroxylase
MMSIASHLNDNLDFSASAHSPGYPATDAKPFTNPRMIQLAEYGKHDFYKIHSDNSFAQGGESSVRSNYRSYTCILYCNDNWTPAMGGALRLYPGSREFGTPEGAIASCEHVDINPLNGRLLIFDSCLTHSVEQVTQSDQTRRALTLWITRPNDSGVAGESFY